MPLSSRWFDLIRGGSTGWCDHSQNAADCLSSVVVCAGCRREWILVFQRAAITVSHWVERTRGSPDRLRTWTIWNLIRKPRGDSALCRTLCRGRSWLGELGCKRPKKITSQCSFIQNFTEELGGLLSGTHKTIR